ncbi:hypothetical protein COOONC_08903 [Cooperia oncophora]
MDVTTILTMFREMMDEQKNVIAKLLDRIPERGQGDCNATEHMALPNLMAAQRLITILDRDHKAGKTVSLQQLHQECENFLSLKRDSEVVAGTMKLVEATSVQKRKEIECWNCEGNHRASGCQAKPWFCKKCRKVGHKEKFCDTLRQKKTAGRTEATQKTQHTKEKFSRNRNNRGPRKQVRIVKIANAAVQANSSRVYIDAVVNNYSVKFLLDTGSDITPEQSSSGHKDMRIVLTSFEGIYRFRTPAVALFHPNCFRPKPS